MGIFSEKNAAFRTKALIRKILQIVSLAE